MAGQIFILFSIGKLCRIRASTSSGLNVAFKRTPISVTNLSFLIKYKMTRNFIIYITYTKTMFQQLDMSKKVRCGMVARNWGDFKHLLN